jgi:tetratricopeptide (TPR) repeat protein
MVPKYIIAVLFFFTPGFLSAQQNIDPRLFEVVSLSQQGQTEKAKEKIKILKAAHLNDTTYAMVLTLSMEMEEKDNNYEQAIKDNEECLKLAVTNEKVIQQNMGRLKKNTGDFAGSEKAFKRVIELDSSDDIVYINMAILYNYTYRYREAVDILKAKPNQSKSEFITNSENRQFAMAFFYLEKYDTAKIFIDKFIVTDNGKKDEVAFYEAAVIYSNLNDSANACKFIQQANGLIVDNKIDVSIETASENIKKRWFYKRYVEDIKMIKNSSTLFCKPARSNIQLY